MKIAFYGNVCNNFYTLAKALRSELGVDAHLYLNPKADIQNLPESDEPSLKGNYPDWIHMSRSWDYVPLLGRLDKKFINELNRYDVVFLSQMGVTLASFLKNRKLFYVTGGDLTQIPFPAKFSYKFKNILQRLIWEYIGFMQRKGIRSCTKILTQPFFPFVYALNELGVDDKKISKCYFPILIDTGVVAYSSDAWNRIDSRNKELLSPFTFIILHPSRINLDKSRAAVESGQWKGNDNLFNALAIFMDKYKVYDICVAMPDRIFSPDISKAKDIISGLGIEQNIVWLKTPGPQGFPRKELIDYYSISDMVADEFATGWFGSIVVEGMACGKPTLCYVDQAVMGQLYPDNPILSAREPADIAELIASMYFNKEKKIAHGALSRQWVLQYHSIQNGTRIYLDNFRHDLKEVFNFD